MLSLSQEVHDQGVEIVFVSSDRSPEDMVSYMQGSHGDWQSVEHGSETAQALKQKYGVSGIPCLVVVKKDGTLITKDGRAAVQSKGPMAVKEWV
jgi:nucleoredoxin